MSITQLQDVTESAVVATSLHDPGICAYGYPNCQPCLKAKLSTLQASEMTAIDGLLRLSNIVVFKRYDMGTHSDSDVSSEYAQMMPHSTTTEPAVPDARRKRTWTRRNSARSSSWTDEEVEQPTNRRSKHVSFAAEQCKRWCSAIKELPAHQLPQCWPPKEVFDSFNGSGAAILHETISQRETSERIRGALPVKDKIPIEQYSLDLAAQARINPRHPILSEKEQRFIAAFNGRLSESVYEDCKHRIFTCARWRTEEDGLFHNTESSQQCCSINVNTTSIIHQWFDSMGMFNRPWNLQKNQSRPSHLGHLSRATQGRNGRTKGDGKVYMNKAILTEDLRYPD